MYVCLEIVVMSNVGLRLIAIFLDSRLSVILTPTYWTKYTTYVIHSQANVSTKLLLSCANSIPDQNQHIFLFTF